MSVVPGDVETETQPPMTVPLRHFVVALGLLLVGLLAALGTATGVVSGLGTLAHVHLLLAGWVCVTIMGAMTQFVPVWSAVALHSRRLATAQLWLVTAGLLGFAGALVAGRAAALAPAGAVMLAGFWTFVYNVGRTLAAVDGYDVTERHFAFALACFLAVTTLGVALAVDFARPVLAPLGLSRIAVVGSHATLAVFGAVLATVVGALYQLATMFTQTELTGLDVHLQRIEETLYPAGVVLLAGGRLAESVPVARVGGVLVAAGLGAVGIVLAHQLVKTRVEWTPMLSRYAVVAPLLVVWAALALPVWIRTPLAAGAVFGWPGTAHLLVFGAVGFVVFGTLYHVVPFIVWVHRYSDLLGYEPVPMIDDLYSDCLARADFGCLLAGFVTLVATDVLGLDASVAVGAGVLALVGAGLFAANLLLVVRRHSPHSLTALLVRADSARDEHIRS